MNWNFAFATDIHVGTPRSYRYQAAWNRRWQIAREQIIASNPEFLVLGGDLTRDGATHRFELEQVKADFESLPFPYYAIPGNHEVGNKVMPVGVDIPNEGKVSVQPEYLDLYASVFGKSEWSFVHKDVRFSGLNSFLPGSGFPEEDAMWRWLEAQTKQPRARQHVWFLHSAVFVDRVDEPNWDIAEDRAAWYFGLDEPYRSRLVDIFKATGSDLVISGHIHCRHTVVQDEIRYVLAPSTAFPQWGDRWPDGDDAIGWFNCEVTDDSVELHFVPIGDTQEAEAFYGPGGNPTYEMRDYGLAQEQPALDPDEQRYPA